MANLETNQVGDLARYHRQMLLPGFGLEGQERLRRGRALVVGCGALGSMIAGMLARAGVGHLVLVDRDFVELTNLQRQILYDEADVREAMPKAEAARRKLAAINGQVQVTAVIDDLNHTNAERLAGIRNGEYGPVDVILDGLDNFETRFLLNDVAVKHGIPYVYGGAVGTVGMSYTILPHTPGSRAPWEDTPADLATPCLRCVFDEAPPPGMSPTCDTAGVLGPVVAVVASYQASEALKVLTGHWEAVNPALMSVDLWQNEFRQVQLQGAYRAGACPCCGQREFEFLAGKLGSASTVLCGRDAVQVSPRATGDGGERPALDLAEIARRLAPHGAVTANAFMLRAQLRERGAAYELTLFADGRAIVKGTKEAAVARAVYAKYVGA